MKSYKGQELKKEEGKGKRAAWSVSFQIDENESYRFTYANLTLAKEMIDFHQNAENKTATYSLLKLNSTSIG